MRKASVPLTCCHCCCSFAKPAGLSNGGVVSGKMLSLVNPPAVAAANSVASVSRSSNPGSPEWLYKSTNPGPKTSPRQSLI